MKAKPSLLARRRAALEIRSRDDRKKIVAYLRMLGIPEDAKRVVK